MRAQGDAAVGVMGGGALEQLEAAGHLLWSAASSLQLEAVKVWGRDDHLRVRAEVPVRFLSLLGWASSLGSFPVNSELAYSAGFQSQLPIT